MRAVAYMSGIVALWVGAAVGQQPPPAVTIGTEQLASNLYVLRGGGENTAVFITENGVVLVDGKNPGLGSALVEAVARLTAKPITTVINTHVHHTITNTELPDSFEVIAHEETARLMREGNPVSGLATGPPSWSAYRTSARGFPTRTFKDRLTIGTGADRIELYYFGRGHTSGDIFVVFPAARVLHTGDAFSGKQMAVIDANNGGVGVTYAEQLERAAALPDIDRVIPGHGPGTMTTGDLREHAEFVRQFVDVVAAAKKAGNAVDDVVASWKLPSRFQGYTEPTDERVRTNASVIWQELQ